jgi:hypothetical protein
VCAIACVEPDACKILHLCISDQLWTKFTVSEEAREQVWIGSSPREALTATVTVANLLLPAGFGPCHESSSQAPESARAIERREDHHAGSTNRVAGQHRSAGSIVASYAHASRRAAICARRRDRHEAGRAADSWRERPDMDPHATRLFRASTVARARFIEDLVMEKVDLGVTPLRHPRS